MLVTFTVRQNNESGKETTVLIQSQMRQGGFFYKRVYECTLQSIVCVFVRGWARVVPES